MAVYYNPGALGNFTMFGGQFTHSNWLAGITYDYAIATVPIGGSSAAMINVTSLRSGDIAVRTVEQPQGTGENYSVNDLAFGTGFGTRITDRIAIGIQLTYMQETIWHSSLSAFGMSLGIQYKLTTDGIVIGASLSNFGSRNNFTGSDLRVRYDLDASQHGGNSALPAYLYTDAYGLPIVFRVGLCMPVAITNSHEFLFVADALHPNNNTESVDLGVEYSFSKLLFLRAGWQDLFQEDAEVGFTAGAGVMIEAAGTDIRFDYGWTQYGRLGNVQRMTVGFAF
jgi:hypothetical protein